MLLIKLILNNFEKKGNLISLIHLKNKEMKSGLFLFIETKHVIVRLKNKITTKVLLKWW